ncbi:P-selectin-like isoform X2 [Paroedura picta]|uniref:P-selectin-like isoform X2 n=2 Tax=Paroedura picta TaxID=143630 RepID=UPI0040562779
MGVRSRQLWYRWMKENTAVVAVISLVLSPMAVEAWTYHYGTTSELTWEEARTFCQTFYTDLVAIQNQEEIQYLNKHIPRHKTYYWIGIRKINNVWIWVGTKKTLSKEAESWAKGEPNNKRSNQDCVEIYIKRDSESGKWNDEPCTRKKRALCYTASCQPSSCSQNGECVETIGNYTCRCYPGFSGPECEDVVKCQEIEAVHKPLSMNCSHPLGNFSYKSSCVFSCDEGFEVSGPDTLQCLPYGNWSAQTPQCVDVQCRPLNAPAYGERHCSPNHRQFQYQSSCHFNCREGFVVHGAETSVCEASGEWTSPEPICQAKQCKEIESPARGTMNCTHPLGDFAYNSTCSFACEAGFQLSSSEILHCNASSQWTAHVPTCHAVQCQPLGVPIHGNFTCSHLHGDFQYQSRCTFHCPEGFQLLGEEATSCTAMGEWTSSPPECQALKCHRLQRPEKGEMICSHPVEEFAFQSVCEFTCEVGFALAGTETMSCLATGNWSDPSPTCQVIGCSRLDAPRDGGLNCSHLHGDFAYSSVCSFSCNTGFVLVGPEMLQCTAQGTWTEKPPFCEATHCPILHAPDNGHVNCSHPHEDFSYGSSCNFFCNTGFQLVGSEALDCLAVGNWTRQQPSCKATHCPILHAPDSGHFNCSHPHEDFAYGSSCNFFCNTGFQLLGSEALDCLAVGNWTQQQPSCKAVQCPALGTPDNGWGNCSHPHGSFAFNSSCVFSCDSGFRLVGSEMLQCVAQGNWTGDPPMCEAIQCPALGSLDKGWGNCSHPHGSFAFNSSCVFSCDSGFRLVGSEMLQCMAQGNWTGDPPMCEAIQCPALGSLDNGQGNCSHPHGSFAFNSSCIFSCDSGFRLVGSEMLQCAAQGNWTGDPPMCEAVSCPQLEEQEHTEANCSHPWGPFRYNSTCHFHCANGFLLNGTRRMECQPDGHWSAKMPHCEENVAPFLKQVLLYTGSVTASVVGLLVSGTLIALIIRRLSKKEEKNRLLNSNSDLGATGVFSNVAFDSFS